MRFEKARDIFDHVRDFHTQLSTRFEKLAAQSSGKVKLLLDYIVQHQREQAAALAQYEEDAPTGVLETWFQYANDKTILNIPEQETFSSKKSIEDIVELSMHFSDELIELYQSMAEQADELQLKDVFSNLTDMQKQDRRQFTMGVDRLMDL